MRYVVFTLFSLGVLAGCASGPQVGSLDYIDRQVYQCRELCSAGTVDVTRIEGLNCVCNTRKEAPIFYNPMLSGSSGAQAPIVIREPAATFVNSPTVRDDATKVQDASGRTIFSQGKE